MTSQLEKLFMHWIFKNPSFFKFVKPHYFGNEDIKFIYECVLNEYDNSKDKVVSSTKEIITLVQSKDTKNQISNDLLKVILKIDWNEYRDDFIIPRFRSWVLSNSTINGLLDSIELIKNIDKTDYDKVLQNVETIKATMTDHTSINLGSVNIGVDFDDPDAHNQENHANKITTGYDTLDTVLGGGWDRKTLSVLMGEVNQGKSLWGQQFVVNAANAGYNVGVVSLEMSEKKVLKRLGAIRLSIPISQYDDLSKDRDYMREKIEEANKMNSKSDLFDKKTGKIYIIEYGTGTATVNDIDDWIKLVHEVTGHKIDLLVVDYIQIMKPEARLGIDNMLYLKGKHFAEGLRALAKKYDLASLTMTQIDKSKYGANDIMLNDMPESKAIADTADVVFAIIRTAAMKLEGKYHLKPLKFRDGSTEYERIGFDLNKVTLKIHNDHFIENAL